MRAVNQCLDCWFWSDMIAKCEGYCGLSNNDAPNGEIIALASYKMADDMLKAREA